jgi:hypothetical protein
MKYFIMAIILSGCVQREVDPLVQMSQDVEKKDRGIDIRITPVEKESFLKNGK